MGQTIIDEKIVARMDKAYDMLLEKIGEHNKRYEQFIKEFWTNDVQDMFKIVKESFGQYVKLFVDDKCVLFNMSSFSIGDDHCWTTDCIGQNKHDSETISNINYYARKLESGKKVLKMFMDNAEDIIEKITIDYQEIVELQNDRLDKVFDILGADEPKSRHIKVTIEWV